VHSLDGLNNKHWHQLETTETLQWLGSDTLQGLSEAEAHRRLAQEGPNELIKGQTKRVWRIIWEQLVEPLVVILIVAALVSASLGDYQEAIVILIIVLLNALLGVSQEYRSERAMAALRELAVPTVKVRRGRKWQERPATDLVVGDIVLLEAGNRVPADLRLLETANLRIQESALTGEAEPVEKDPRMLSPENLPLGDRRNMAYLGTVVLYGRGYGVVTATGMNTELGHIAAMLHTVHAGPTPLQQRLEQLGKGLVTLSLAIVGVIFVLGLLRGEDLKLMFLTAVSIAVAAVPEGLPAVVTIALALGSQRMLRRHALIRKLPAVETLGSVTTICSDKTGTLTENRMTVTALDVAGHQLDLTAYLRHNGTWLGDREIPPYVLADQPALGLLLMGSTLCNDAVLEVDPQLSEHFQIVGEPTEGALVRAAAHLGLWKSKLEADLPRLAEIPFDAQRRRMTTLHRLSPKSVTLTLNPLNIDWPWSHQDGGLPYIAFTKGAVDSLLQICSEVWVDHHTEPLTEVWGDWLLNRHDALAQEGTRVLGVACKPCLSPELYPGVERDLIFIGLVGMSDPIRPEAKEAVQTCISAGIRPVMITGDHPLTAQHIARELGLALDGQILTGQDLTKLSIETLTKRVQEVSVYARVTPEDKLKIIEALQRQGQVVAMTGDGVNDAPALKKADIGIAMGITGTDVAKEAADMALLDDNFATIVAAVREGRTIYDNIRKFVQYLLSSNTGEIWVMLIAPFLGMPLPLLPLQILWINLMTDGLPALALGVEPAERHIMQRPPYAPRENLFSRGLGISILWIGILMGALSLGAGYGYWAYHLSSWQTILFTVLTLSQLGNALALRSERASFFHLGLRSNPSLIAAVIFTFGLQMAVIYIPFLQAIFDTVPLSFNDLLICLLLSSGVFWAVELKKWRQRFNRP
jgi:Ca2+-transporting ATPase